jgi:hypothetical protein
MTKISFENWHPGQPDGYNRAQDCVQIMQTGFWDDMDCYVKMSFICEHQ